ncbi:MAG TPA: PEP-CTERM sorting domain-containing protein [Gemmatimonadaceae bacterium]|jgi:hypothetical protein|nr:PEP-CTERM sorting domain-containing protein [Gemmatimonadaceae bacterium]
MRTLKVAAAALVLGTTAAEGQVTRLTFEGLMDTQLIGNYYNGGAGGNLGITFGTEAVAVITRDAGGLGRFQQAPSGVTAMAFVGSTNTFMNVAAGFDTGFSLFYTSPYATGFLSVYSGLGGTGTLLGSALLPLTPKQPGTPACPTTTLEYCPWIPVSVAFSGTAGSVVFGGATGAIGFDNITFGSIDPSTPLSVAPEPGTWALLGSGLVVLAGFRARRRRATIA